MNKIVIITEEISDIDLLDLLNENILIITKKYLTKELLENEKIDFLFSFKNINPFVNLYYYLILNNIVGIINIYIVKKLDKNIRIIENNYLKKLNKEGFETFNNIRSLIIDSKKYKKLNLSNYIFESIEITFYNLILYLEGKGNIIELKEEINKFRFIFDKEYKKILLIGNNNIDKNLSEIIENFFVIRFNINIPTKYCIDKNRGIKTDMIFMGEPVKNYFMKNIDKKNKIGKAFKKEQLDELKNIIKDGKKCIFRSHIKKFPFMVRKNTHIINNLNLKPVILDNLIISIACQKWKLGDIYIKEYNKNNKHLTSGAFMIFFLLAFGIKPNICGFCDFKDQYYFVNYNKIINNKMNNNYNKVQDLPHHDVVFERWLIKNLIDNNLITKID